MTVGDVRLLALKGHESPFCGVRIIRIADVRANAFGFSDYPKWPLGQLAPHFLIVTKGDSARAWWREYYPEEPKCGCSAKQTSTAQLFPTPEFPRQNLKRIIPLLRVEARAEMDVDCTDAALSDFFYDWYRGYPPTAVISPCLDGFCFVIGFRAFGPL